MSFLGTITQKVGKTAEVFRKKITVSLNRPHPVDEGKVEALERQIEQAEVMRSMTNHPGWALYVEAQHETLNAAVHAIHDPMSTKTMEEVRFLQGEIQALSRELTRVDTVLARADSAAKELKKMQTPVELNSLDLPDTEE